jgi:putative methyltransferase (TIGR04325 family)
MISLQNIIKDFLPPILSELLVNLRRLLKGARSDINEVGGFQYDFSSFKSAEDFLIAKGSNGYNSDDYISKLHRSAELVRDGKAAYERDTFIFDEVLYSWPLLSGLLLAAGQNEHFHVVDFGGALGSTFRQNEKFLNYLTASIIWTVIEQESIVEIGKKFFETDILKFVSNVDQLDDIPIQLCLFSGSLCYVSNPYQILEQLLLLKPKYLVIDRTPLTESESDLFGVQYVPANLFKASYPIVFLSRTKLYNLLSKDYNMVEKWISDDQPDIKSISEGSLWAKK